MRAHANQLAAIKPHQFKPGHPGGPGRSVGSRNKLTEAFLDKMHADFIEHGDAVIERVRQRKPEVYLMAVAALVPKKIERPDSPLHDISDEELELLEQHLAALRAKTVQQLELAAEPEPHNGKTEAPAATAASQGDRSETIAPNRHRTAGQDAC